MNKTLTRAVAVSAVCAAGLAGTLASGPTASADGADAKGAASELTDFGMKAVAFGTKVNIGGVELKTVKDAKLIQACTRTAGKQRTSYGLGSTSLPIPNDLINVSASKSDTQTYTDGAITGVRGINTIAHVKLNLTPDGLPQIVSLPTISLDGLTTTADSFYDKSTDTYGADPSFTFGGLTIDLPDDTTSDEVGSTLQTLFDIIGVQPSDITEPVTATVNQLLEALTDVGVIQIPGLGTIALGKTFTKHPKGSNFASSGANALQIVVDTTPDEPNDETLLKLGYASSRISKPVRSGVFRSTVMGLDFNAGVLSDDVSLLHMGGIGTESIPCEGTGGDVVTKKLGTRSIPLGVTSEGADLGVAKLTGLTYSYMGKQLKNGRAKSMVKSRLGALEIPALGLKITGATSKLDLVKPGKNVKRQRVRGTNTPIFRVADITHNGESIIPAGGLKIGETISFVDDLTGQENFITFGQVRRRTYYGADLSAIKVDIPGVANLKVGWAESAIYPR
ncbi:hypothetical protein [Nocardioides acrostichi]|uniref:Uncharacterized protein n=1 Tax=Nocardioides acrostichi TaxID=2784339 RepID=A0A930UWE4_9ACTN|nr:hypothetical protein [Nocardioides acrostichi]MBF4160902.1 hypothetical protein [Nocardioides acrostichi]